MGHTPQSIFSFHAEKMSKKKIVDKVIEIDGNNLTNETQSDGSSSNGTSK